MKKVVINRCFGGFSLSPQGVKRMAELAGRPFYLFSQDIQTNVYSPMDINEPNTLMFWAFDIPNPNEVLGRGKDWAAMSQKERIAYNELYAMHQLDNRDIERHDPHLVQTVEELGKEASGRHAELTIVEIPDDVNYVIEEYDGLEHIAESHRTWR